MSAPAGGTSSLAGVARLVMDSAIKAGVAVDASTAKQFAKQLGKIQQQHKKKGGSLGKVHYNVSQFVSSQTDRIQRAEAQAKATAAIASTPPRVTSLTGVISQTLSDEQRARGQSSYHASTRKPAFIRSLVSEAYQRKSALPAREASPLGPIDAISAATPTTVAAAQVRYEPPSPPRSPLDLAIRAPAARPEHKLADVSQFTPVRRTPSIEEREKQKRADTAESLSRLLSAAIGVAQGQQQARAQPLVDMAAATRLHPPEPKATADMATAPVSSPGLDMTAPKPRRKLAALSELLGTAATPRPSPDAAPTQTPLQAPRPAAQSVLPEPFPEAAAPARVPERKPLLALSLETDKPLFGDEGAKAAAASAPAVAPTPAVAKPSVTFTVPKPSATFTVPKPTPTVAPPVIHYKSFTAVAAPDLGTSTTTAAPAAAFSADEWEAQREREMNALRAAQRAEEERREAERLEQQHQELGAKWVQERQRVGLAAFTDPVTGQPKARGVQDAYTAHRHALFFCHYLSRDRPAWEHALEAFNAAQSAASITNPLPAYFYHVLSTKTRGSPGHARVKALRCVEEAALGNRHLLPITTVNTLSRTPKDEFLDKYAAMPDDRRAKLPLFLHKRAVRALVGSEPVESGWERAIQQIQRLEATRGSRNGVYLQCLAAAINSVRMTPEVRQAAVAALDGLVAASPRAGERVKVLQGLASRGFASRSRLQPLLQDGARVTEYHYAALMRSTKTEDIPDLVLEMKNSGLDMHDPVVVQALISRAADPSAALAAFDEAVINGTPVTRAIARSLAHQLSASQYLHTGLRDRLVDLIEKNPRIISRSYIRRILTASFLQGRYDYCAKTILLGLRHHMQFKAESDNLVPPPTPADPLSIADLDLELLGPFRRAMLNSSLKRLGYPATSEIMFETILEGIQQRREAKAAAGGSESATTTAQAAASVPEAAPADLPHTETLLEFAKDRNWQGALQLLPQLPQRVPTAQVPALTLLFNCILSAAVEVPLVVDDVFARMKRSSAEPNATTYNTVMSSFSRHEERWEEALGLFAAMPDGVRDLGSYSVALSTMAKHDLPEPAIAAYQRAAKRFPKPPAVLHGLAIQAVHRHSWEHTLGIFQDMVKANGTASVKDLVASRVRRSLELGGRKAELLAVEKMLAAPHKKEKKPKSASLVPPTTSS